MYSAEVENLLSAEPRAQVAPDTDIPKLNLFCSILLFSLLLRTCDPRCGGAWQPTIVFVWIGRNYNTVSGSGTVCSAFAKTQAKSDLAFYFFSRPSVEGKWKRMMINRISSRLNFTIRRNNNHYREFSLPDKFLRGAFFLLPIYVTLLRIFLPRAAANFIVNLIAVKMILRRRKSHIAFFFNGFFFLL